MAEKVTIMVLKVDLECSKCYKKTKRVLCQFHQVRDQIYDEKTNTVTIKVVCCSPEKIREKICCKGGGTIKSIEIIEQEKKPKSEKKKEPEKKSEPEKKKEPEKKPEPEKKKEAEEKKPAADPPKPTDKDKPAKPETLNEPPKIVPEPVPKEAPVSEAVPVGYPSSAGPMGLMRYEGYGSVPCYYLQGVGMPPPRQPCYCGCGRYDYCCGGGRPLSASRCDYFSDENPSACAVM